MPHTIYNVANELKKHEDFQTQALFLFRAYQAERFISKQGELLELKHTGDAQKFRAYIRRSCLNAGAEQHFTTLQQILDAVTARVVTRLLNQGKLESIRNVYASLHGQAVEEWKDSFDEDVFFSSRKTAIQWASEHIARIDVEVSDTWRNLRFKTEEEAYAEALLWGHFGELLFNALKYSDPHKQQWAAITFSEEERYLTALWQNPCSTETTASGWRSKGLDSIRNDLEMLNQQAPEPRKSLEQSVENNTFSVKLYFDKHVFFYQSRITHRPKHPKSA